MNTDRIIYIMYIYIIWFREVSDDITENTVSFDGDTSITESSVVPAVSSLENLGIFMNASIWYYGLNKHKFCQGAGGFMFNPQLG